MSPWTWIILILVYIFMAWLVYLSVLDCVWLVYLSVWWSVIGLFICMMVCDWFIYLSLMVCDWFIFRLHQSQFLCVLSPEESGWGWLSVWILFHCYRGKEEKRDLCNLSLCLFVVCLKNTDIYLKNFFLKKGNHFKFQRDNTFFNCV